MKHNHFLFLFLYSFSNFEKKIVGDAVSECETSYYSEYDPFDYLYSSGTQCSDPVYAAVIKIDRPPLSPAANVFEDVNPSVHSSFDFTGIYDKSDATSFTTPDWDEQDDDSDFTIIPSSSATAPPLPPRNITRNNSNISSNKHSYIERTNEVNSFDRLKVATKLYDNVVKNKTYDAELIAFYNMVSISHCDRFLIRYKYNLQFFFFVFLNNIFDRSNVFDHNSNMMMRKRILVILLLMNIIIIIQMVLI